MTSANLERRRVRAKHGDRLDIMINHSGVQDSKRMSVVVASALDSGVLEDGTSGGNADVDRRRVRAQRGDRGRRAQCDVTGVAQPETTAPPPALYGAVMDAAFDNAQGLCGSDSRSPSPHTRRRPTRR